MGGLAATELYVVFGSRDALDSSDVFICLDAHTGRELWRHQYPALPPPDAETRDGRLDFGNSPRATPLITDDRVITLGAFGDLNCLDLATGKPIWTSNLLIDFAGQLPLWGYCGSPLLIGHRIIVQPGADEASLVCINLFDGEVLWESPGRAASYSSFIVGSFAGRLQIVGMDATTLGGWDLETGERIWELEPPVRGEFQVPTPVRVGERLLVVGENNGARLIEFDNEGQPLTKLAGHRPEFRPDTHTPVIVGTSLLGLHDNLYSMSTENLELKQEIFDDVLTHFGSLISNGRDRLLILTDDGKLLLYSVDSDSMPVRLGTLNLVDDQRVHIYSHPALVGSRFYFRTGSQVNCLVFP